VIQALFIHKIRRLYEANLAIDGRFGKNESKKKKQEKFIRNISK